MNFVPRCFVCGPFKVFQGERLAGRGQFKSVPGTQKHFARELKNILGERKCYFGIRKICFWGNFIVPLDQHFFCSEIQKHFGCSQMLFWNTKNLFLGQFHCLSGSTLFLLGNVKTLLLASGRFWLSKNGCRSAAKISLKSQIVSGFSDSGRAKS